MDSFTLKSYKIWELGQRSNQEDSIYPEDVSSASSKGLFIVCDGMGGHDSGEVASSTVSKAIGTYIESNYKEGCEFTEELFNKALDYAYDELDALDTGAAKKMGTTLTFLKIHGTSATVAHIGDSRVYHIRPGEGVMFVTSDHSLVNDLVKIGEITPEQARNHPRKNVITRAVQPHQEVRSKADIHHIEDILPGDYFFLCTDGMLEDISDDNLVFILSQDVTDEEKVRMLKRSSEQSKDNHSAFLVHVVDSSHVTTSSTPSNGKTSRIGSKIVKCVFWIVLFLLVGYGAYSLVDSFYRKKTSVPDKEIPALEPKSVGPKDSPDPLFRHEIRDSVSVTATRDTSDLSSRQDSLGVSGTSNVSEVADAPEAGIQQEIAVEEKTSLQENIVKINDSLNIKKAEVIKEKITK